MKLFAVFNHWLHLFCVVLWLGGAGFQVFIMAPLLAAKDVSNEVYVKISKRYQRMVILLLFILMITGGINFGVRRAGIDEIPPGYISALGVKVFLVCAMAAIPLFQLVRSRDDEEIKRDETSNGNLPGYTFTKVTLIVGVVVIFIAAMLRQWKF
ncbi:MAG: CopD family protein [Nitrospira sp.]|nr:hypothetical protein [Candidatus Manganitrophaceae bacterium]HIL35328.1 hypothetical protein [Candidatus Manganitrophaceae bacterium]